jgi:hypothetical protein
VSCRVKKEGWAAHLFGVLHNLRAGRAGLSFFNVTKPGDCVGSSALYRCLPAGRHLTSLIGLSAFDRASGHRLRR